MGPMLMKTPPHVGSKKFGDIKDVFQLGWALRKHVDEQTVADITRLFTMSATDLLDRWFETPADEGVHVGQRHHRHLGRARRARHRLRA